MGRVPELNDRIGDADGRATMLRILQRAGTTELSPYIRAIRDEATPISTDEFTSAPWRSWTSTEAKCLVT